MVAEVGTIMTVSGNDTIPEVAVSASELDAESARWIEALTEAGAAREAALARLHELLLADLNAAGALDWSKAVIDSSHVRAVKGGPKPVRARSTAPSRAPGTT